VERDPEIHVAQRTSFILHCHFSKALSLIIEEFTTNRWQIIFQLDVCMQNYHAIYTPHDTFHTLDSLLKVFTAHILRCRGEPAINTLRIFAEKTMLVTNFGHFPVRMIFVILCTGIIQAEIEWFSAFMLTHYLHTLYTVWWYYVDPARW